MSILATKSARHTMIRQDHPLSDDMIQAYCPSIFASQPHSSRSEHYAYISTADVLQGLRKEGFEPFMAAQAKCRSLEKREFTRHLMRFRHPDSITSAEGAHEIILLNSHDGTSAFQLLGGFFRFVCMNGHGLRRG